MKYREFWLSYDVTGNLKIAFNTEPNAETIQFHKVDSLVHVIEHAAYKDLEDKLKVAKEELEVIADNDSKFPAHVIAKSALKQIEEIK